jgi:Na+-driven multidrug efflux pump
VASVLAVAFLVFPEALFGIFTSDSDVLAIVRPYLPILMLSFAFAALRPITRALIDGSGNRRINLIAALLDAVVARVGFALVFGVALSGGYMGLWFGVTVAELVPILIGAVFYFSGAWMRSTYVPSNED